MSKLFPYIPLPLKFLCMVSGGGSHLYFPPNLCLDDQRITVLPYKGTVSKPLRDDMTILLSCRECSNQWKGNHLFLVHSSRNVYYYKCNNIYGNYYLKLLFQLAISNCFRSTIIWVYNFFNYTSWENTAIHKKWMNTWISVSKIWKWMNYSGNKSIFKEWKIYFHSQ